MARELRDWQRDAIDAVHGEWDKGVTRTAIVAATGLGKSSVIGKLAVDEARAGGNVLLLAHREELLSQLAATCRTFDPAVPVGIVQAERDQYRRPIIAASVATLRNAKRQARLPRPSLVVVDECHRAVADSYLTVLARAGSFDGTRTLGVTATMTRGDRRGLGDCWQTVALVRDIRYGIDHGYLVKPRGRCVVVKGMHLEQAKVTRGDYQDAELGEMVEQSVDEIVKAWQDHAEDRITVAFVPTVAAAEELRDAFLAQGVAAEAVTGGTSTRAREAMYARLAAGKTRVLVNVFVLVEGWDCPAVSCVLMARPTRLPGVYTQAVGRALRTAPGKDSALVLDVVGASRRQKLVTLVDLHATAEYDTDELDTLPCDECGGAPRGQRLTEQAPYQCTCGDEGEDAGPVQLSGPVEYSEVDLFAASSLNWLFTRNGLRFLPAGDRLALLWPAPCGEEDEPLYVPGHCEAAPRWVNSRPTIGGGHWLPNGQAAPLPLHDARVLAERWAAGYDASLASRQSSWRRGGARPSDAQLHLARRLGIAGADTMTKARLSDEISIAKASRLLDVIAA